LAELREQIEVVRDRRDAVYRELITLMELADMPPEYMGWA